MSWLRFGSLVNPSDPKDVQAVHALQDAIKVDQPGGPGKFATPQWDQASQKTVRDGLLTLAATVPNTKGMFGARGAVDPVRHLIGAASAWGGNPEKDTRSISTSFRPRTTAIRSTSSTSRMSRSTASWSVSVYNAKGYFEPNLQNAYTLNNITATANADGSVPVQFGGCDGNVSDCLPITPGWELSGAALSATPWRFRDGGWTFPEAKPAD